MGQAKVLLTGAFGNVGANTVRHLLRQRFDVVCLDVKNDQNEKTAALLSKEGAFETVWGDLREADSILQLVQRVQPEAILHVAAIIAPLSYVYPQLSYEVNVNGTHNLVTAAQQLAKPPKMIYVSSYSVHGPRNPHRNLPPLTGETAVNPHDNYGREKVQAEQMVQASGLPWSVIRLPAVLATSGSWGQHPAFMRFGMLLPLDRQQHALDSRDAGLALTHAVLADVNGRLLNLGGPDDCRLVARDFMRRMLEARGVGELPESAFRQADPNVDESWYYEDFVDTAVSQQLLNYQQHSFQDHLDYLKRQAGLSRFFIQLFAPLVRRQLLKSSSTYGKPQVVDSGTVWEAVCRTFELDPSVYEIG